MNDQERQKLERKRERNRKAASKCRKNKLEKISTLEDAVKNLKGENGELRMSIARHKEYVASLKQVIVEHVKGGCQINGAGTSTPN
jgi:predicted RNase H-like nuclease (RuvC/YqgF family)